jgi:PAS domain S-box-containing protein
MIKLPANDAETRRVEMVRSFGLLEEPRSLQHDEIAALARSLAATEWGLVSLVDCERLWFSGASNFVQVGGCRWSSFCTHVVAQPDAPLWVEDARTDLRFAHLPSVVTAPGLRFYAGVPILVNGYAVGSMCVFGSKPRPFDPGLLSHLSSLARIVAEDLAARHRAQSARLALTASADALIDCDNAGQIMSWSAGAERLFGFSAAEALGSNINIIVPPHQKAAHDRGFDQWSQHGGAGIGRRRDLRAQRKDGSPVDIELWMSAVYERGVPHIHANIRDISERKAHAHSLEIAKAEAQAANEAKSIFLANMSHELRTPLNGVVGLADILCRSDLEPRQREAVELIRTSGRSLERLLGDILQLAQIEAGEVAIVAKPFDVAKVTKDVTDLLRLKAEESGSTIDLHIDLPAGHSRVGDEQRFRQILTNLTSNAVKFTARGSTVVSLREHPGGIRVLVKDTGIGFAAEQKDRLFERFQQADGSITRRFGGTGLGLAITAGLVDKMGGEISCESTEGVGSTFWADLPFGPAEATIPEANQAPIVVEAEGLKVLVADDHPVNRRVMEMILEPLGIEVVAVENGAEAVEAVSEESFDVVLMDMQMPVMDGLEATRTIVAAKGPPVVMVSANGLPQHVEAALEAGAVAFVTKPIQPADLIETVIATVEQAPVPKAIGTDAVSAA